MRVVEISGPISQDQIRTALPRASVSVEKALEIVTPLIQDIKTNSLAAVLAQAERFDGVRPEHVRVPQSQLDRALYELAPDLRAAIQTAIERVRKVSEAAVPKGFDLDLAQGAVVSQRYVPVDSVGLYVPGGKAVYPSSVVMNAVAAQAAGVPRIAIASPPQKEFGGLPHPAILATAALLGVTEVYAIGGAAAVAAFGYGIKEIDLAPVRMVTGPGNIYVAAAKRALRGLIGIDSEAGPTEILIIADKSANPASVAADLISQAEHDENAAAVLVTDSRELITAVQRELDIQVANTSNIDRVKVALAGVQSALVLVPDLEIAVAVSNEYATEHLEIQTADPQALLPKITNAGAIFLGEYSPVSLGDYLAGSNHVLPTGEQAKFGPGLGVHTFLRPQQIINYSRSALESVVQQLDTFAIAEGLSAHGDAAKIRFTGGN
ncbi:MAG: histidinol dehydrogenase [Actinomycetota bacterium]|nr:histidinol dehydrogenase [Actinomycetota bacterium]